MINMIISMRSMISGAVFRDNLNVIVALKKYFHIKQENKIVFFSI